MPPEEEIEWTTLDWYVPADIKFNLWDLAKYQRIGLKNCVGQELPEEEYDEIHAYEILEHFGEQGNPLHFFNTFNGLWEMLKPGGLLIGTSPGRTGEWVWGDPGHTRVIATEQFSFLQKKHYDQLGKTTSSDYRSLIGEHWWEILHLTEEPNKCEFALKKVC